MDFRFRDKCAYREAWLKFGANIAVHRSACILGALAMPNIVFWTHDRCPIYWLLSALKINTKTHDNIIRLCWFVKCFVIHSELPDFKIKKYYREILRIHANTANLYVLDLISITNISFIFLITFYQTVYYLKENYM